MSELKVYHCNEWHNEYTEFYMKDEADKVIAELKGQVNGFKNRSNLWHYNAVEEHKKFVQADKVIAELKDKLQNVSSLLNQTREWLLESQKLHKKCADNAVKVIRHHKYKRCLAMALWCERNRIDSANFRKPRRKWNFYYKWHKRWLELACKFKDMEAK